MPIPTYDPFIDPMLRYLVKHPDGARTGEVHEALADEMGFSEEEREELLPSGVQAVYKNRIGWAHDRLKRAGLSSAPKRIRRRSQASYGEGSDTNSVSNSIIRRSLRRRWISVPGRRGILFRVWSGLL